MAAPTRPAPRGTRRHPGRPLRRHPRGTSLIEVMAASSVFLIGLLGLAGAFSTARTSTGVARRQVWAAHIAQDLTSQAELWAYDDARLAPATRVDAADEALALEGPGREAALEDYAERCHAEAALTCEGDCAWGGIPGADLEGGFGSDSATRFQRFWCVELQREDGGQATADVDDARKRITVVVTYTEGARARRYVSHHVRYNPRFRSR
jgi:Tfp pilus assembly protein PilV